MKLCFYKANRDIHALPFHKSQLNMHGALPSPSDLSTSFHTPAPPFRGASQTCNSHTSPRTGIQPLDFSSLCCMSFTCLTPSPTEAQGTSHSVSWPVSPSRESPNNWDFCSSQAQPSLLFILITHREMESRWQE